ncbi:MAG: PKD domain-containing protein [Bacteroidota bacterium]
MRRGSFYLKLFSIVMLGIVLALAPRQAEASHAMGADLTYQCMGGNTYKVRLSFYRDCVGIAAPFNVNISIKSNSCGQTLSVTCNRIPGTGQEVTYLCPTATSTCNGGSFTGIQEYVYEGVVTLPMQCPDWEFSYTNCCRNTAISTIQNPGGSTIYLYAKLDNTGGICNNAPTFTNKPVPFACLGQQFCFNHGATDVDGDSLVYSLVNPRQTETNTVTYLNPYNANNPLNSSPALSFNTATGDICFSPTQLQVTVMAVLVKEYRNGQLIGSVVRDIQVTVLNCNNDLPTLTGINGTTSFTTSVCANQQLCFFVNSNDINGAQNLSLTYNNAIPGATFTQSAGSRPTGTFCWTPGTADISTVPYCFTVRVQDNACPFNGANTYSYCITVGGLTVNAGPDQSISCSSQTTVSATTSGANGPVTYAWSNGASGPSQTVGPGTYVVTVTDGSCTARDTVVVNSGSLPVAAFSSGAACANSTVSFTDQSTSSSAITQWSWNFGDGAVSSQQNPQHVYAAPGNYQVSLVVTAASGCTDTVVQTIGIAPQPVASFTAGTACAGVPLSITNSSSPAVIGYAWTFSNGTSSTQAQPSITFSSPGSNSATLVVTDANGCRDTLVLPMVVNAVPVASFTVPVSNCQGGPVNFVNTSTGGAGFNWTFGDSTGSFLQNPSHTYATTGTFTVNLTVTNAAGCTATASQLVQMNAQPLVFAGADQSMCLGSNVTLNVSGGVSYVWSPGGQTSNSITISPSSSTSYVVTATNANGCTANDTVLITVLPLPLANVSPSQSVCDGESVTLVASGGVAYSWNPSGVTNDTLVVTPGSSTSYAVDVIDANGCQSTAFTAVTVQANPILNLSPGVFICSGLSATLNPGVSGVSYLWSTGATTSTVTVNSQGAYTLTVTNPAGCTASGTTQVTVSGQTVSNNTAIQICQGETATIQAGQSGVSFQWSTGSSAPSITVNQAGTYSVTVTDANGCTGTISHTVQVNPLPQAIFTPVDECLSDTVYFNDNSVINGGSAVSWSWDLGDGNISFAQNPTHVYNTPGSYNIVLTVTSNMGCTSTVNDSLNIYPMPQALFSSVPACQGSPLSFTDMSTVGFGNIVVWNWDFGDGTTSTQQHPQHVYAAPGNYLVTLHVMTPGNCSGMFQAIAQVYPKPDVSFVPSDSALCLGESVNLVNTSNSASGAISAWQWSLGNNQTSSQYSPSVTYVSAGTYPVVLIGTTSLGCSDTAYANVVVNALPSADAGANAQVCTGDSVTLSASGGVSYQWSPISSITPTVVVSPSNSTTYNVVVTDANGCVSSDSIRVNVLPRPTALAGPDQTICFGDSVQLNVAGGITATWSPGGFQTALVQVSPPATTTYVATVTDGSGCTATDTLVIIVNPLPSANAGPDTTVCDGGFVLLTASGGGDYLWLHNAATTVSVAVNPAIDSIYQVLVTNSFGCTALDSVGVRVLPNPVVAGGTAFFCSGGSIVLDAGVSGVSYEWLPTGDSTQSISVSDSGTYQVIVAQANGCLASGFFQVAEGGGGLGGPALNVLRCQNEAVVLDANNPGMSYLWSNGATTQTTTVSSPGMYTVTVTDPNGCSSVLNRNVIDQDVPQVSFTVSDACEGDSIRVLNTSSITSGQTLTSSVWSINGQSVSSQWQPTLSPLSSDVYSIGLTLVSGSGCTDSAFSTITVHPNPTASFHAGRVCLGTPLTFFENSTVSDGSIQSWTWNFGDGNQGTGANQQHTYAAAGIFIPTLIVTTDAGCSDTLAAAVLIDAPPVVSFIASDVCEGDSTAFTNLSQSILPISDINWDFGDGNISNDVSPVHKYASPGSYQVTLRVGNNQGCESTSTSQVNVFPKPQAAFNAPPVCAGDPLQFTDQSVLNGGVLNGWYWSFGDGGFSALQSPVHLYTGSGTYTATLAAISSRGCTDSTSAQIQVNALPSASFGAVEACVGAPVVFTDSSLSSGQAIVTWQWNFGDGTTASGSNASHSYAVPGTYAVTMDVTTADGCFASVTRSINVFPIPEARFSAGSACVGSHVAFIDQSTVLGGSSFNYAWNFGDNSSSSAQAPTHTYAAPGDYAVQLTITTPAGCSASTTSSITIHPLPVVSFTTLNVCLNEPVALNDASAVTPGSITAWSWDLGDSTVSSAQNPTHFYAAAGIYMVTLQATSSEGCTFRATQALEVFDPPTPQPVSGNGCSGSPVAFSDTSSGLGNQITAWEWSFGDGTTASSAMPMHQYQQAGTWLVSLTTTNVNGCRATATTNVIIGAQPDAGFTAGTSCADSPVQFNNMSIPGTSPVVSWNWNFGDGTPVSTLESPTHIYANPGLQTVTLIVTTAEGCTDTLTRTIFTNPLPIASFPPVSAAGCGPLPVAFTDASFVNGGSIVAWSWTFGDGNSSSQQNPVHNYTTTGNYQVTLTVTSDSGCTGSYTQQNGVTVYPSPVAEFEAAPWEQDILNPVFNFINLSSGGLNNFWTFGDGGQSIDFEPQHVYRDTGNYMVTLWVTNSYGCRDSVRHPVRVNPIFSVYVPNAFTPNGDGMNEGFNLKGEYIVKVELSIFNRWGEKIFFSEGRENSDWDGRIWGSDVDAPEGVYVYLAKVLDVWGQTHEKVGQVSLVR